MRILLDQGVSPKLVEPLRELGHECSHVRLVGLGDAADREILDFAATGDWVIVTHDADFVRLLVEHGSDWPSVVHLRVRRTDADSVRPFLVAAVRDHSGLLEAGAVLSVIETKTRVRPLPINAVSRERDE